MKLTHRMTTAHLIGWCLGIFVGSTVNQLDFWAYLFLAIIAYILGRVVVLLALELEDIS